MDRIHVYEGRSGIRIGGKYDWASHLRSYGSPPRLAFGARGRLVAAIETKNGQIRFVSGGGRSKPLAKGGPVTALLGVGMLPMNDYEKATGVEKASLFAFGTLEGRIHLLQVSRNRPPQILALGNLGTASLAGRVRLLKWDTASGHLMALGDKDEVLTARLPGRPAYRSKKIGDGPR